MSADLYAPNRTTQLLWRWMFAVLLLSWLMPRASAQVSASISGLVTDPSGAPVPSAEVTVKSLETGWARATSTDATGRYLVLALPVGSYEVTVRAHNFRQMSRPAIQLAVGQEARVDFRLTIFGPEAVIEVMGDVSTVSTSTADISGLVSEKQIKDLPINGRSYDLLMPLNPGIVNFTSQKTGGTGISNSTTANNFAVSGNRPQQNLFLLNGVEYTGAAENNMQPGGPSGMLLGVDAVREFNVQRDSYGAEFGKRPGGQILIVTQSGSNQLHGAVFEFLRNSALDAPNVFDQGSAPPFQRNQFGAALGGPLDLLGTAVRPTIDFRVDGRRVKLFEIAGMTSGEAAFDGQPGPPALGRIEIAGPYHPSGESLANAAPRRSGFFRDRRSVQQPATDDSRRFRNGASRSYLFAEGHARSDLHRGRRQ